MASMPSLRLAARKEHTAPSHLPGRNIWEGDVRQSVQCQLTCGPVHVNPPDKPKRTPPRALVGGVVVGIVLHVFDLTTLGVVDILHDSGTTSRTEDGSACRLTSIVRDTCPVIKQTDSARNLRGYT